MQKVRRKRSDLRPFQRRFIKLGLKLKAVYFALLMGAGKTIIALTIARLLLDQGVVRRVLIVGPKRVCTDVWPDEIDEWEHTYALTYAVAAGEDEKGRIAAIEKDAEITLINRENLRWLFRYFGRAEWPYDMLIYDEASRLKEGKHRSGGKKTKHKRYSEFGSLAAIRHKFCRVILLSGTPSPNGIIDLWGPAYILDLGRRLGTHKTHFLNRWFIKEHNGYSYEPHSFAFRQIMERLKDVMFSLHPDEYPQLPRVQMNNIFVSMTRKQDAEYKEFKSTLVSEAYDIEAVNRGVLTMKLLQFANGSMYRKIPDTWPEKREVIHIHDAKLDALESIITEANGEPVLVAYSFQFDLDAIKKRFPKAVVFDEEPNFKKLWNARKIKIGLAHPASIGHGQNIQYGGHIAVWYGLTYSLELYQQFNKRLHRPGQTETVTIHHILTRRTDDERVMSSLHDKNATQESVIRAVRESVIEGAA